jgi:aspergillopepsin I
MPDFQVFFKPPKAENPTHYPAGKGGSSIAPYTATVPGAYMIGSASGNNDGMCQGTITSNDKGNGWDIILGDVFLMSQLVVFDLGNSNGSKDKDAPAHGQVGFAPKPQ